MPDDNKSYYRPREAAAILGIPVSTLRYWEVEFKQLNPPRSPVGHRRYRPEDIELCRLIKHLLRDKGYSQEYAIKELDKYRSNPPRRPFVCKSVADALRLLADAKGRCEDDHAIARIASVENWLRERIIT